MNKNNNQEINPIYCRTCKFSKGEPPFEDGPEKEFCMIYAKEIGLKKANRVYYEGKICEYYREDKIED